VVTGLLDTAVVVDLLRLYPPASDWLAGQTTLGLSPVVWLEIIEGASDSQAQEKALKLLRRFELISLRDQGGVRLEDVDE